METQKHLKSKLDEIISQGVSLTPMMQQYHEIKQQNPGILLLFRMGDFYELFFEDAIEASKILNITLTHRGKLGEHPIPMAGIPYHAASNYVDRITQMGLKAAICEQIEDPKMAKGLVRRAITQIASPAMPYDLEKINGVDYHFIASVSVNENSYYLTLLDYTTGHLIGHVLKSQRELLEKLQLYHPKEFISYFDQWQDSSELKNYLKYHELTHTYLSREYFSPKFTQNYIEKMIPNYQFDTILSANPVFTQSIGAISYYIISTQASENYQHIKPFKLIVDEEEMKVSYLTLTGLEIVAKNKDSYKKSLIGFMDKTCSALGVRKLKNIFLTPTRNLNIIESRQQYIDYLISTPEVIEQQRNELKNVRDIERIMAKMTSNRTTAGDLIHLANSLEVTINLNKTLGKNNTLIKAIKSNDLQAMKDLAIEIRELISDEIGAALEKGNLIKKGYSKERDRLEELSENSAQTLLELEQRYRNETAISNLRIKSNNVAGFFVEISKSHIDKVPKSFHRRQTLVNSERYVTDELDQLEKEILAAKDKLLKLDREFFYQILETIKAQSSLVHMASELIAYVDVFQSFAWVAIQENFIKPHIETSHVHFDVEAAFHPLIKKQLGDHFTPHHLHLSEKCPFGLITGPNMAGKTTVMREMAIIQFLAQIGSYVPAKKANIGLCDYLFSRLGASDDILSGQSTFMVEMSETAEILRHASRNSLIILDEIGRGTSTYDGLSIAWALVEYITSELGCLTLFSTHYHELIELVDKIKNAKNLTVRTHKEGEQIVFLYELIEQGATQSFGINVAALAGLPSSILRRSEEILSSLEKKKNTVESSPALPSLMGQRIKELNLNNMTPLEALNILETLQKLEN